MLIENLHRRSNLGIEKLNLIAATASRRYKVYEIPKRDGTPRKIEHPSKELKAIQRWLVRTVLRSLPVHPHATAYKKGARIANNANAHALTNYTLRLDFSDFFPSFSKHHVISFLQEVNAKNNFQFTPDDIEFSAAIFTRYEKLTIGAPSSPMLTNAMMYEFDCKVSEFSTHKNVIYTRYADDLFFSSNSKSELIGIESAIEKISQSYQYGDLRLNKKKTTYLSRKYNRTITGLVITTDRKVSIGRSRKREIKSLLYRYKMGFLDSETTMKLMGLVAFAADAEPEFFTTVVRKYGQKIMDEILNR